MLRLRGTGPRATVTGGVLGRRTSPFPVGLGPSDAIHACERVSLAMLRLRGTGPRATVTGGVLSRRTSPFPVGRGPVPRHAAVYRKPSLSRRARACPSPCCVNRKIAGDRPPRYGKKTPSLPRRARACPSPCCVNRKIAVETLSDARVASEGPRATVL